VFPSFSATRTAHPRHIRGPTHPHKPTIEPHPRQGHCDVPAHSVLPARARQLIKRKPSLNFATAIDPYTSSVYNTHSGIIMLFLPTSNTSNFPTTLHNYQVDDSHQYQDEAELIDDIPALDFGSPESFQLLQTDSDAFLSFDDNLKHPMQSDSWGGLAQLTPKIGRYSHHRESSLSSLGSTGPTSPYNQNTSNPQIAISDSAFEGLSEMHSQEFTNNHGNAYYQLAKSMGPPAYQAYHNMDGTIPDLAYPVTVSGPGKKARIDRGLLPAHELAGTYARSHPASVASSVGGDSPATPAPGEVDQNNRRRNGTIEPITRHLDASFADLSTDNLDYPHVPRLDRTMTDVYGDELYNPNFTITSASSPQPHSVTSAGSDVFNQRINAANYQHLSATHSPASTASRARSPFRTESPFAATSAHQFNFAQHLKDNAHRPGSQLESAGEPETPKTISPKDAVLEFNESETDGVFPLFPQDSSSFELDPLSKNVPPSDHQTGPYLGPSMVANPHNSTQQLGYLPSQIPTGIHVPQQYPFIARPSTSTPPRLSSSGASSVASGGNTPSSRARPISTGAEGGTYTCTYHGCTMRFETPTLLQKHKREGHRQTQSLAMPRVEDMGMTSNLANTQAGPHRCDRINPSTGKPCHTVFSRPYDLTRHEDTIHNARKQKVRCNLCTEEKTFSRADALTRHYRVCHPDMELPGKSRRRG
jgi:hypothetical protein